MLHAFVCGVSGNPDKKMEPMIGIDKEGLPDAEPERSEGNRP